MSAAAKSLNEIRKEGVAILAKELGPVGMIRFLQQFDTGTGNYTKDRHQWLTEQDVTRLAEAVQGQRPSL
jgi:hypothetical protein